jgi:hypothetical protein
MAESIVIKDPRIVIRQMVGPYQVRDFALFRDGTIAFEIVDSMDTVLSATLESIFQGAPRRLTLGGREVIAGTNAVRYFGVKLTAGGPTEKLVFDILSDWLAIPARSRTIPPGYFETVSEELRARLNTTKVDDLVDIG